MVAVSSLHFCAFSKVGIALYWLSPLYHYIHAQDKRSAHFSSVVNEITNHLADYLVAWLLP